MLSLVCLCFSQQNETNLKQESSSQKMEEYKAIILQMNKERLRLERQLADLMKARVYNFDP